MVIIEIAETETSQHTRGTPVFLVLYRIGGELGEHCRPPHRRNHADAWKSLHFQRIRGRPSPPPYYPQNENAWESHAFQMIWASRLNYHGPGLITTAQAQLPRPRPNYHCPWNSNRNQRQFIHFHQKTIENQRNIIFFELSEIPWEIDESLWKSTENLRKQWQIKEKRRKCVGNYKNP